MKPGNYYVYRLQLVERLHKQENWDAQVMKHFEGHSEYLKKAAAEGIAQVVARTDVALKDNWGIVIFQKPDVESAKHFMQGDPAVKHGLMTAELFPFKVVYTS